MRSISWGMVSLLLVGGCRAATRVTEVPRVDLELRGGNRGYVVGTAPETATLNTTRQMIQTDIELPSFYRAKRPTGPLSLGGIAPPETDMPGGHRAAPESFDTYVVQKGDTLWSIAAKPNVLGKATRWRELLEANRDLLPNPDKLRAGMTLKIPRGGSGGGPMSASDDGGTTYTK